MTTCLEFFVVGERCQLYNFCKTNIMFCSHSVNGFLYQEALNRCDAQIIYNLVLCNVENRAYYDTSATASLWSDEEDERRKCSSTQGISFQENL